jgi:hypothetical protein
MLKTGKPNRIVKKWKVNLNQAEREVFEEHFNQELYQIMTGWLFKYFPECSVVIPCNCKSPNCDGWRTREENMKGKKARVA